MGWRYEVQRWFDDGGGYNWETTWTGRSLVKAFLAMRDAKRDVGAVRLTWR